MNTVRIGDVDCVLSPLNIVQVGKLKTEFERLAGSDELIPLLGLCAATVHASVSRRHEVSLEEISHALSPREVMDMTNTIFAMTVQSQKAVSPPPSNRQARRSRLRRQMKRR